MLTLYDYLRAGHVKRWHIVETIRPQSIAEHSFLVTIIALHLHWRLGHDGCSLHDQRMLVLGSLFHDAPEVRTGDVPSHSKGIIRSFADDAKIFDRIDEVLMPSVPYTGDEQFPTHLHRYIKMADTIEAAHFIREQGVGAHAATVAAKNWEAVQKLVAEYSELFNQDWYGPVNEVLMALGMPYISREERISPP